MSGYYFDIRKASNGQFYFRFRAANHETIVHSETYTTKQSCSHAISLLQVYAAGAAVYDNTSQTA